MENKITGTTDDGENLLVDVNYNKSNREAIEELEELSESDDE